MARKHPDRPLYVTTPRDIDSRPEFAALSLHAQWLLQRLDRDPYRLGCGVLLFNPVMVARHAKATAADVLGWLGELENHGWVQQDEMTGELWLTQHMEWDFTLASPNQAKGVLRDLKRVQSAVFCERIARMVASRYPMLNPIDPDWEGASQGGAGAPSEHPSGDLAGSPEQEQEPKAQSTKPSANSTKHTALSPQPEPEAHSTGAAAPCVKCNGAGLIHGKGGESKLCACQLKVVGQ